MEGRGGSYSTLILRGGLHYTEVGTSYFVELVPEISTQQAWGIIYSAGKDIEFGIELSTDQGIDCWEAVQSPYFAAWARLMGEVLGRYVASGVLPPLMFDAE